MLILRQVRIRESLGLRTLPDSPEELHFNYSKLEKMELPPSWVGHLRINIGVRREFPQILPNSKVNWAR
jgi:hypothetical protein